MAVDRPEITQVQRFEQVTAPADKALDAVVDLAGNLAAEVTAHGELAQRLPDVVLQLVIRLGSGDVREIFLQRADIRVDAHTVVIQDDQQVRIRNTRMVHSLEGQARRHRAIADDRHRFAVSLALIFGCHRHAQRSADRSRRMPHTKTVVFTLAPVREPAQPVVLSIGCEPVPSACQDLMTVGLMTYIPDQLVIRCIKNVVKGDSQFDYPQAGRKMAAMNTDSINDVLTEFIRYLVQLLLAELFKIFRRMHRLQQRSRGNFHSFLL
jgi:hypothetical protein